MWPFRLRQLWMTAALFVMGSGVAHVWADDYRPPVSDEMAALHARLDAQERELQSMREALAAPQRGQFASLADEALGAPEDIHPSGLREIQIIASPTYKLTGRIFVDYLSSQQDDRHVHQFGNAKDRTRFDTARIGVEGHVYENVLYKFEMAFGETAFRTSSTQNADRPVFKDVYLEVTELSCIGHVRIGHFKEPLGLEQLTSSRFITFLERSLMDAVVPGRNLGLMAYNHIFDDETLSWYTGAFRAESDDDPPDVTSDLADYAWTSRIAWNPYYDEPTEGRYLVHIAAGFSNRQYGDSSVSFTKDHELNLFYPVSNPLQLVNIAVDHLQTYNVEAAWQSGPFHVSGEWTHVRVNAPDSFEDGSFDGAYVQAGYFLTGEHRGYRKSMHAFDRVEVYEPFFCIRTADGCCKGCGAWELKARWSYLDLADESIRGGRAEDFSFGVNWYLNSYCRFMFDYIRGHSEQAPNTDLDGGYTSLFGARAQVDW